MNRLPQWIETGKLVQFVSGLLNATEHAIIFEAAKVDPAVASAIHATKTALIEQGIAAAKAQDPDAFIASGMLEAYIEDRLPDANRQMVELMVAAHPQVGNAYYNLKGAYVEAMTARVRQTDVEALVASTRLSDYVLGEGTAEERLEIEMCASLFPAVREALDDLLFVDEALVFRGAINPPAAAKDKFASFLETSEVPADGWSLVMPMLNQNSRAADFKAWIDRVDLRNIDSAGNLNAIPLEVDQLVTTLFVVVKECLEDEIHLNVIERFLVLEGSCVVRMGDKDVHLQQGDYYSIPKFVPHTIVVTSSIPCKLIVQQVAA